MSEHVLTDTFYENLDLHPLLQQGLADCGFTRCTPIQALTLPVALTGRDVAGQAQTGTGKTCAFLVALMNRLLTEPAMAERKDADPRALVIAPTRELAIQIEKDAAAIGRHTGLRTALIYGGVDYEKQRQQLKDGCDIIIATPGRLLDYYKQQVFSLNAVQVMVIDEADRMFDLGFIKDVRYIFRRLPARDERQVLLFSATLSHRVLELAYEHMNEAEKLVVETENVTADRVRQVMYFPAKEEKMPLLLNLLSQHKPQRSIIFANTKAAVERLTERLKRYGYRVGALSGDVPQAKRQKLLARFQDGAIDMLVATDVAARGLHIPAVSHVFNYDLPQDAEDYVHRIGRTARLGAEGDAVSFACDLYAMGLPDIEAYIEQKIPVESIEAKMLVMPEPPPKPKSERSESADADESDDTSGSSDGAPRKRRRRRSGSGGSDAQGTSHAPAPQASSERPAASASQETKAETATADQPAAQSTSEPSAAAGDQPAADGAPRKRRRRRGGRNRNRNRQGGESQGSASDAPSAASGEAKREGGGSGSRQRGSRQGGSQDGKPRARIEQGSAGDGKRAGQSRRSAPSQPRNEAPEAASKTISQPSAPSKQKQPGLLKRLASSLFGR
ncbi:DEAD/DEAH box helicase [Oleiagrimonas sp. C23AA]|nr:DEAD/DEAH box helicase [Oleiagrimonas sp. C23AA]